MATVVLDPQHPAHALKAMRAEKALSLRALSVKTGMPFSTLSKLENGKIALTYDKLVRLAQGLGVDVGDLIAGTPGTQPAPTGRRSVALAGKSAVVRSAFFTHRYPAAELLGKLMEPTIIDVMARSVDELGGLIRHSGEEYLYILEGSMELHSDLYAPLPLASGDSVYFDSGMAHAYVRTGDRPCRVLSISAGPGIKTFAQAARRTLNLGD